MTSLFCAGLVGFFVIARICRAASFFLSFGIHVQKEGLDLGSLFQGGASLDLSQLEQLADLCRFGCRLSELYFVVVEHVLETFNRHFHDPHVFDQGSEDGAGIFAVPQQNSGSCGFSRGSVPDVEAVLEYIHLWQKLLCYMCKYVSFYLCNSVKF